MYTVQQRTEDVLDYVKGLRLDKLFFILDSLPQVFSPIPYYISFGFISKNWYDLSEIKLGKETWWAPHNLWRQPFHGIVTVLLYLLLMAVYRLFDIQVLNIFKNHKYNALFVCYWYGFIKEVYEFIRDKKFEYPDVHSAVKKSISDVVSYVLIPALVFL